MTKAEKTTLRRAANALDYWAKAVFDSGRVRVPGDPAFGQFADTPDGRADKKEFDKLQGLSKELRRMARAA